MSLDGAPSGSPPTEPVRWVGDGAPSWVPALIRGAVEGGLAGLLGGVATLVAFFDTVGAPPSSLVLLGAGLAGASLGGSERAAERLDLPIGVRALGALVAPFAALAPVLAREAFLRGELAAKVLSDLDDRRVSYFVLTPSTLAVCLSFIVTLAAVPRRGSARLAVASALVALPIVAIAGALGTWVLGGLVVATVFLWSLALVRAWSERLLPLRRAPPR